jgi:H/ACA ribonucleoprotein complex subunit 4
MTLKGEAVALPQSKLVTEEILNTNHGVVANLERVLMERGIYPKVWKTGSGSKDDKRS